MIRRAPPQTKAEAFVDLLEIVGYWRRDHIQAHDESHQPGPLSECATLPILDAALAFLDEAEPDIRPGLEVMPRYPNQPEPIAHV